MAGVEGVPVSNEGSISQTDLQVKPEPPEGGSISEVKIHSDASLVEKGRKEGDLPQVKPDSPSEETKEVEKFLIEKCKFRVSIAKDYAARFLANGYENMVFMEDLETPNDLGMVYKDMPIGHRKRILKTLHPPRTGKSITRNAAPRKSSSVTRNRALRPLNRNSAPADAKKRSSDKMYQDEDGFLVCVLAEDGGGLPRLHSRKKAKKLPVVGKSKVVMGRQVCVEYSECGTCSTDNCPYLHDENPAGTEVEEMGSGEKGGNYDRPCFEWKRNGFCHYGRQCKYKHDNSGFLPSCDSWLESGTCAFGDDCRFLHGDTAAEDDSLKIFIGGLPSGVCEADLEDYLTQEVGECRTAIPPDKTTKLSRGFGFATFLTKESKAKALQMARRGKLKIQGKILDAKDYVRH